MARYHVRADGSMGVCTAKDGHCPFGAEEGTKHFTSESEARAYSEKMIAGKSKSRKALKRDATTAIGKDAVRVDSCSRTLYGDVDVDKARAEVNQAYDELMKPSWNEVKSKLASMYDGEDLQDAMAVVAASRYRIASEKPHWDARTDFRPGTVAEVEADMERLSVLDDKDLHPAARHGKPANFLNQRYDYVGRNSNGGVMLLEHSDRYFTTAKRRRKSGGDSNPTEDLVDKVRMVEVIPDDDKHSARLKTLAAEPTVLTLDDATNGVYATTEDVVSAAGGGQFGYVGSTKERFDECKRVSDAVMDGGLDVVRRGGSGLWADVSSGCYTGTYGSDFDDFGDEELATLYTHGLNARAKTGSKTAKTWTYNEVLEKVQRDRRATQGNNA